jgi:hypothetical protein
VLAAAFAALEQSPTGFSLPTLLHCVRLDRPTARAIFANSGYLRTLGRLLFEADTEVLTMTLLVLEAVLAAESSAESSVARGHNRHGHHQRNRSSEVALAALDGGGEGEGAIRAVGGERTIERRLMGLVDITIVGRIFSEYVARMCALFAPHVRPFAPMFTI